MNWAIKPKQDMERKELIGLTSKIYKITLLFPKKEPLRYKIREIADKILEDFISLDNYGQFDIEKSDFIKQLNNNLEIIDSYLEVAKWQNWLSYFDILNIKNQYGKIKQSLFVPEKPEQTSEKKPKEEIKKKDLDIRKEKILGILKQKELVQVWEVKKSFPDISKRTLRRDFEYLLKNGFVQRIGEKNNTFYKIIS